MKGILFRISLVGFLPLSILCLWELTQGDSPAEMVLAVGFLLGMIVSLSWASWNVIRMARRSVSSPTIFVARTVVMKRFIYFLFNDL